MTFPILGLAFSILADVLLIVFGGMTQCGRALDRHVRMVRGKFGPRGGSFRPLLAACSSALDPFASRIYRVGVASDRVVHVAGEILRFFSC